MQNNSEEGLEWMHFRHAKSREYVKGLNLRTASHHVCRLEQITRGYIRRKTKLYQGLQFGQEQSQVPLPGRKIDACWSAQSASLVFMVSDG